MDARGFSDNRSFRGRVSWLVTLLIIGAVALFSLNFPTMVTGDENQPNIVRIEEYWILQIGVPEAESNGPQVVTTISPQSDLSAEYAVFELNHATQPSYQRGGMQLQGWTSNAVQQFQLRNSGVLLQTSDEAVSFTVSMELKNGQLKCAVENGTSTTWGSFGTGDSFTVFLPTNRSHLNSYSPDTSAKNSGISFASYRVKKLVLSEIRYYSSSGLIKTDSLDRVVHSYSGSEQ